MERSTEMAYFALESAAWSLNYSNLHFSLWSPIKGGNQVGSGHKWVGSDMDWIRKIQT